MMKRTTVMLLTFFSLSAFSSGEHGHEESESASVGEEKGIIEANEKKGFKLSDEALKNFDLKYFKLTGDGPWPLPTSARVFSGEEVNLFRKRDGFFKRIDFETVKKNDKKTEDQMMVDADDMREGDEIVLSGMGFLRIA